MFPKAPDDTCGRFSRSEREIQAKFYRPSTTCGEDCALLLQLGLGLGLLGLLVLGGGSL